MVVASGSEPEGRRFDSCTRNCGRSVLVQRPGCDPGECRFNSGRPPEGRGTREERRGGNEPLLFPRVSSLSPLPTPLHCVVRHPVERPVSETGDCGFDSRRHNFFCRSSINLMIFGDRLTARPRAFEARCEGSNPSPRLEAGCRE